MATLDVTCPNCEKAMRVPPEAVGKRIRCKACSHVFTVADAGAAKAAKPLPDDFKKPAKPAKPAAAKPASPADEPKPAEDKNAPLAFADDDEDGPKEYRVTKDDLDVPRCPRCAKELEAEDDRICLNCGYDMQERIQRRTVKTYQRTSGDYILYWLPAVIWFGVLAGMIGLLVWMCFQLGTLWRENDILVSDSENPITGKKEFVVHPMACDVCCGVFILGLSAFGGPVIWRRLKNPSPPEEEKKK
jgi:hypothetical protein